MSAARPSVQIAIQSSALSCSWASRQVAFSAQTRTAVEHVCVTMQQKQAEGGLGFCTSLAFRRCFATSQRISNPPPKRRICRQSALRNSQAKRNSGEKIAMHEARIARDACLRQERLLRHAQQARRGEPAKRQRAKAQAELWGEAERWHNRAQADLRQSLWASTFHLCEFALEVSSGARIAGPFGQDRKRTLACTAKSSV